MEAEKGPKVIVGFIGLGRMGGPMATRIADAGYTVVAYDISPSKLLTNPNNLRMVDSPADVARAAKLVFTSLPGPHQVDSVVYGHNGILPALLPGAILTETSTISPKQSQAIAVDLAKRGVGYLDAPISGGARGAVNGTLAVMVGGPKDVLEFARPVLTCFAKNIFHLGPTGAGNAMKIVIQSIFLSQMVCFLEAVSLGERCGIHVETLLDIVASSAAHHPTIATRYEKIKTADLDPMFEVASAEKDLSLAESLYRDLNFPASTIASALASYRAAAAHGLSRADLIGVRTWLNSSGREAE